MIGVPLLLVVSFSVFALVALSPGDPAASLAGENPTPERIAAVRESLHLGDSLFCRYFQWRSGAIHGELGTSLQTQQKVWSRVREKLAITASIVLVALVFIILLAVIG